jgi:hypothetical protein
MYKQPMSIQYFKRERGGVSPVGWTQPFIQKDPPKGIFTRKYEPVNVADTMYMMQPDGPNGDPTRINEGVQFYARGQNPMVEVSYSNAGAAMTNNSLGNAQASNPYKVEVVRPPITSIEALQPISAPRMHQNYAIMTNPGIYPQSVANEYDKSKVRLMTTQYTSPAHNVKSNLNSEMIIHQERYADKLARELQQILKAEVVPTYSYNIDNMRETSTKYVWETKDLLPIASTSPISFTNITVFDPRTNTNVQVEANIKEKNAIAVTAAAHAPLYFNTNDGQVMKLKDYEYKVVAAPYGNTQLTIYVRQDDVKLERNTPLYAAQATMSMAGVDVSAQRAMADKLMLESVLPLISATASVKLNNYNEAALRESFDLNKFNLQNVSPQVAATAAVSLNAQGYNEENMRSGKKRELDKMGSYGSWDADRTSKPNLLIRGMAR